jgi:hypothetical protein
VEIAAGIGPPAMPVLALAPQSIAFGTQLTTIQVGVSNAGTGLLDVDTLTISTTDGANWLAATPVAILAPVSSDTSAISVHVDRSGLADGLYTGSVAVASNGGVQSIDVVMAVDSASLPVDIDLFRAGGRRGHAGDGGAGRGEPDHQPGLHLRGPAAGELRPDRRLRRRRRRRDLRRGGHVLRSLPSVNEPEVVRVAGTDQAAFDFPVTGNVTPSPVLGGRAGREPVLRVVHP